MANKIKQTLKNYWFLWTTIGVGIVGLALQLFGNACFRVPAPDGLNTLVPTVTCPMRDYVAPITIILIVWLAILITMIKTREMVRGLRQGNFGIDILAIIAIAACLIAQEFWAAYIIILMLSSGEALEKLADRRARHELSALIKRRPQSAHLVIDDTISNVPLAKIKLGDRLLVKENEVIPVDGILSSSHATMDESSLTGESMPVDKSTGDKIISGTICQTNKIYITATSTAISTMNGTSDTIHEGRLPAAPLSPFPSGPAPCPSGWLSFCCLSIFEEMRTRASEAPTSSIFLFLKENLFISMNIPGSTSSAHMAKTAQI